jgi:DNA-binding GntR family transcriptional regulator
MKYVLPQKSSLKQVQVSDISSSLPDLKNIKESKAITIGKWLTNVIKTNKAVQPNTLLPTKPDLAYLLGVSIGTIQNALRYIEDLGFVESKQCIGTIVKDQNNKEESLRKLTSKRELAIISIKKYIIKNSLKSGDYLPSSRIISKSIGCSSNTTRLALEYLGTINILEHKFKNSNETGWRIISTDFTVEDVQDDNNTLVKKVENDLKNYITKNLKVGDKIPAHAELSQELSVSIKTIHDALKVLIDDGILLARRGRYGTTVLRMPMESGIIEKPETSIFASAPETAFYYYEKTQNYIKKMIAENYEIGSKLPSITELSKQLDLSPNTIRKAFHNLAKEGYLAFSRGRYGGTFVIDIPETDEQTFKWLAVNPKYAEVYKN